MFRTTNQSTLTATDLPPGCSFRESDWHILAAFWHPVAFVHDITDRPLAAKLLDVNLALYRTASGITVAKDQCPHRGVKISLGRVQDDLLICPMHGLHYDGNGVCRKIPSIADPTAAIPDKLRLRTYRSEVRYGILWVCLKDEPIWPLPYWRHLEDPVYQPNYVPPGAWQVAAGRHVENFNDVAHFPWVHGATFGGGPDAAYPRYQVQHTDYGLSFHIPYLELLNRFPDGRDDLQQREVVYSYELTFPFSTLLEVAVQESDYIQVILDTVCPISARQSGIFQITADNFGNPNPAEQVQETVAINDEDQPLVESQYPQELPLDLREEINIPADRMSLAYRKALAEKFNLGAPMAGT
ncbi:MAG: aromatic ring-hydroxylating dioxygenase subunit alpha [Gammaproteobacteria bacterium]|nr:aromatic ring-hydroxylating dioxygenase subunit alpha [Gammaproteobacteria bacterium]